MESMSSYIQELPLRLLALGILFFWVWLGEATDGESDPAYVVGTFILAGLAFYYFQGGK